MSVVVWTQYATCYTMTCNVFTVELAFRCAWTVIYCCALQCHVGFDGHLPRVLMAPRRGTYSYCVIE